MLCMTTGWQTGGMRSMPYLDCRHADIYPAGYQTQTVYMPDSLCVDGLNPFSRNGVHF